MNNLWNLFAGATCIAVGILNIAIFVVRNFK